MPTIIDSHAQAVRVRMLRPFGTFTKGAVVEFSGRKARQMVEDGFAELADATTRPTVRNKALSAPTPPATPAE